jgi:hypothetical protein
LGKVLWKASPLPKRQIRGDRRRDDSHDDPGQPGSAAAAVIMGGLMIQGMVPGAELFTVKAQTTYSVILGLSSPIFYGL